MFVLRVELTLQHTQTLSWLNLTKSILYPLIKDKSILLLRYIYDIDMIWNKSEKQLNDFMNELNQNHPSIKFDSKYDYRQIEFFDTFVYVGQQHKPKPLSSENQVTVKTFLMQNQNSHTH